MVFLHGHGNGIEDKREHCFGDMTDDYVGSALTSFNVFWMS